MKNRWSLFAIIVLCCVTVLTTAVSARSYTIGETDLTVEIDDSIWYVFTRDNLENNPELDELGVTYEYMYNTMTENKAYVDAILFYEDGSSIEFFVIKAYNGNIINLSNYDADYIESFAQGVKNGVEEKNIKLDKYSVYETEYKFVKLEYTDSDYYILNYITVVNGDIYTFAFQSDVPFSTAEVEQVEEIVNSARFEIDPNLKEKNKTSGENRILFGAIRGGIIGGVAGGIGAFIAGRKKRKLKKAGDMAASSPEAEVKPEEDK